MKILCNALYKHLLSEEAAKDILFLNDDQCDACGEGYDLSEIEMAIMQPFYFNKAFLDRMPKLRVAQITGAGYDRVDLEELKKRNIILCNSKGVMSVSIAEDVFAKMLFFSRQIRVVEKDRVEHKWDMFGQNQWMCSCYDDLYGKVLGIMGYGSIGKEIAKRAKAFGMKNYTYGSRLYLDDPLVDQSFVHSEQLQSFYKKCDYIVICLPLTKETRGMVHDQAFADMKESAVLINVARGPIVDQRALINALNNGAIKAAAIDVFDTEPLPGDSELWECPNLFISSHKAGMGDSWKHFIGDLIMRNIEHYKKEKPLENKIIF